MAVVIFLCAVVIAAYIKSFSFELPPVLPGLYSSPIYIMPLVIVFGVIFIAKVVRGARINSLVWIIACAFTAFLGLAAIFSASPLFLSVVFFNPLIAPVLSALAIVGCIAVSWPHKKR
jgi:hypothetical protein